jgi:hypothetical protein
MSMHITQSLSRGLPIAAAALFIQIGSAAAASPQVDLQQQVRNVLTGSIATHAIPRSDADAANAARSNPDTQAFARQLLLGWSVSHVGARATKQKVQALASESTQRPQSDEDFQSTVQEVLLGEHASSRGAM